jgi:hypothetical protein
MRGTRSFGLGSKAMRSLAHAPDVSGVRGAAVPKTIVDDAHILSPRRAPSDRMRSSHGRVAGVQQRILGEPSDGCLSAFARP